MPATYSDTIAEYFPTVRLLTVGASNRYEDLVAAPGSTVPDKAVLDTKALELGRTRVWRKAQAERERRRQGGVRVGTDWFHSDDTSRIQQLGLVLMGANLPPIQWRTMTGTFVTMTPALAQGIFQSTAAQDVAIFTAGETHRFHIFNSATPDTYNYLVGWPPTFGE